MVEFAPRSFYGFNIPEAADYDHELPVQNGTQVELDRPRSVGRRP
jgi:hypothetical protein